MLDQTLLAYQNRSIETAQLIQQLIDLTNQIYDEQQCERLKLSPEEIAFYDALSAHQDTASVLDDDRLLTLTHEIVSAIRKSVSLDWTKKDNARAKLRSAVKRVLRNRVFH